MKKIYSLIFEMINLSEEPTISVIPLFEICSNFLPDLPFGKELHKMLEIFKLENMKSNYSKYRYCFNEKTFLKLFP